MNSSAGHSTLFNGWEKSARPTATKSTRRFNRHRVMNARRTLRFETLEARQVLASYISEVNFKPLFGDNNTDQYIELRGTPGEQIPNGTYFVTLENWGAVPGGPGYIHSVIDVSGLQFGGNGFLVLLQHGNKYGEFVSNSAKVITSNKVGFSGLPDNRFSDDTDLSDRLGFVFISGSFLLVQSSSKPIPGQDADANNDAILDGPASNWNVIDSVGVNQFNPSPAVSYGKINFSTEPSDVYQPGATIVPSQGLGIVARVGASTQSRAIDWVAGNVTGEQTADGLLYRFTFGVFGDPRAKIYAGKSFDSIGDYNFFGGVTGTTYSDVNGDGIQNTGDVPLPGVTVFADTNLNGIRDDLTVVARGSDFQINRELTNVLPNATLTVADELNKNIGFDVRSRERGFNGDIVFSSAGIPWFANHSRMKVEFYREASSVSIDALGASSLVDSYGRLEVFNANGVRLQTIQTVPMREGGRVRLTILRPQADIKYAVMFTNNTVPDTSPFGAFDNLSYTYPEFATVSDSQGRYSIEDLPPDDYRIRVVGTPFGKVQTEPKAFPSYSLGVLRNEHLTGADFGFRENQLPDITAQSFDLEENPAVGTLVGKVVGSDKDVGQTLTYSIAGDAGPFVINPVTGMISVGEEGQWDFESTSTRVIEVSVADSISPPGVKTAKITLTPTNVNEPPVISRSEWIISEKVALNKVIGFVKSTDADAGTNGEKVFSLGIEAEGVFAIDPITGGVLVAKPTHLDFETKPLWIIPVTVRDKGEPPLESTATLTIHIANSNDPPAVETTSFELPEKSPVETTVGFIRAFDQDVGQSISFNLKDGTGKSKFSVDGLTGEIKTTTDDLLFQQGGVAYTLIVEISDNSVPPTVNKATLTVNVENVNDPPTIVTTSLSIAENSTGGTSVGSIQVSDPDPGQSVSIEILSDLSDTPFVWNAATKTLSLKSDAKINFEQTPSYRLTVRATDSQLPKLSTTKEIVIVVTDVNDPPVITPQFLLIKEQSPVGTFIAFLGVDEVDLNQTVSVAVVGPMADAIEFQPGTTRLVVKDPAKLKIADGARRTFEVKATDSVGLSSSVTMTLALTPLNEAPRSTKSFTPIDTLAGIEYKTTIDTSGFVDPEGKTLTFTATVGADDALPDWLKFDSVTRELKVESWNTSAGIHIVNIKATDPSGLTKTESVGLNIKRNESPWKNPTQPSDVNGDGTVGSLDALLVINMLFRRTILVVPSDITFRTAFLDVDGNNELNSIDALAVINALFRKGNSSNGGEGPVDAASTSSDSPVVVSQSNQPTVTSSLDIAIDVIAMDQLNGDQYDVQRRRRIK